MKKIFEPDFVGTKIYNLGTGKGASVIEVVKAFEEASGQKVPYEIVGRRAGDVSSSYATCKLAEKELGWKATRNLVEMCKLMIFKANFYVIDFFVLCVFSGRDMWTWQSKNPQGFRKE